MKKHHLFLGIAFVCCHYTATAQTEQYVINSNEPIMSRDAFNRLVRKDVSYAILGDGSPTQGVKLSLTEPKINVNAFVFSHHKQLATMDFEGKISDGKFTLFENNKFNTGFSLGFNYHLILNKNAYRWTAIKSLKELAQLRVKEENRLASEQKLDKEYMAALLLAKTKIDVKDLTLTDGVQSDAKSLVFEDELLQFNNADALTLAAKYFKYDTKTITNFDTLLSKIAAFGSKIPCDLAKLMDDYTALRKKTQRQKNELLDFEIETLKEFWTSKKLHWLSLHTDFGYQKYLTYDSTMAALQTTNAFAGNLLNVHYNLHVLAPTYMLYFRAGAGLAWGNNLSDFKKRDYLRIDTLGITNGTTYVEETKGVAYFTDGAALRFFPQPKIEAEFYLVPWRDLFFAPGFYLKMAGILGKTTKLPTEIGLVFNVQSKEKDKNYVSILPFVGFDNLLRIDSETNNRGIKNWKIGFKVGLPIGVGR